MYLESMTQFQRTLSRAQATPLFGPLFISPCKAMISIAQIVVGVAGSIFFGSMAAISAFNFGGEYALKSFGHVTLGALSLLYSISNMLTLGLVGHALETARPGPSAGPI